MQKKDVNGRLLFSKVSYDGKMPYLLEHQRSSYEYFLNEGIQKSFSENFPIICDENNLKLEFVSFILEPVKKNFLECKEKIETYDRRLKVKFRLKKISSKESIEQEILICDMPLLTDSATFIVNGSERTIISQIVRSPGFYIKNDSVNENGEKVFCAFFLPNKGTYLQFENDPKKNEITVRINRERKIPLNIFLYSLGLKRDEIIKIFGENDLLINSLGEYIPQKEALKILYSKVHSGVIQNEKNALDYLVYTFFSDNNYDLREVGRYKLSQRLSIYNLLFEKTLAEDLIDEGGKVIFKTGHTLTQKDVDFLSENNFFKFAKKYQTKVSCGDIEEHCNVNVVKIFNNKKKEKIVNLIGVDTTLIQKHLTVSDIISALSCFLNIFDGIGGCDDIDSLNNRRVRCVGELLENQLRTGIAIMNKNVFQKMRFYKFEKLKDVNIKDLVNAKPIAVCIHDFFATSQLSSFLDQTNPLSEIANKRRLSALGLGGISRDRTVSEVRDVHYTHYGRICPIETPEGQSIGLVNSLSSYAKVNKYGFLETPYRKIIHKNGKHIVSDEIEYLDVFNEKKYIISEANVKMNEKNEIETDSVVARFNYENIIAKVSDVSYIDVSPKQVVSLASSCIPFLECDDTTRALMGANMQRQAVPLLYPDSPFVGTGMENVIAHDSGLAAIASEDGVVTYVDSDKICIEKEKKIKEYNLRKFERSNKGTCINQTAIVSVGDKVEKGQIIADGPAMKNGDLSLGKNVTVAFMTWSGYNYEDAIIISDKLVKDDSFTSIYIEEYSIECFETKLGVEEITREIPGVSEEDKSLLDSNGIVAVGSTVKEGDILVGKVTPIGVSMPTAVEKFFMTIFSEKSSNKKDSSLRVKHGGSGIVIKVQILSNDKNNFPSGVTKIIKVYVAQKRKINEGDKMSGRHGNKGVISRILPVEDMPFLADGTPVDIILNPLGVPSRMNIGQVFELHLGLACKILNLKIATPVFDGINDNEISEIIQKANIKNYKTILFDGMSGERFDEKISVGVMYMIKLDHMVEDKCHARSIGPYSLVAQQPLGGKAQNGGQRFGEMEAWALESYGAAYSLREMFTVKSDDREGRSRMYEAIVKQQQLPKPGYSEAFRVFIKELQALCLNVEAFDENENIVSLDIASNSYKFNNEDSKKERKFISLFKRE